MSSGVGPVEANRLAGLARRALSSTQPVLQSTLATRTEPSSRPNQRHLLCPTQQTTPRLVRSPPHSRLTAGRCSPVHLEVRLGAVDEVDWVARQSLLLNRVRVQLDRAREVVPAERGVPLLGGVSASSRVVERARTRCLSSSGGLSCSSRSFGQVGRVGGRVKGEEKSRKLSTPAPLGADAANGMMRTGSRNVASPRWLSFHTLKPSFEQQDSEEACAAPPRPSPTPAFRGSQASSSATAQVRVPRGRL